MILADKFVWMHVPKTGGTWFRTLLEQYAPEDWHISVLPGHYFADEVDNHRREHLRLPRMFFVRNPWDWHVSRFHFWHGHWRARTGGYSLPREKWIQEELMWADCFAALGEGPGPEVFRRALQWSLGELPTQSEYVARVLGEWVRPEQVLSGRFEYLRTEAARLLTAVGCPPSGPLAAALGATQPLQRSSHRPYQYYYDATTRHLVKVREDAVVRQYEYSFEEP